MTVQSDEKTQVVLSDAALSTQFESGCFKVFIACQKSVHNLRIRIVTKYLTFNFNQLNIILIVCRSSMKYITDVDENYNNFSWRSF